MNTIESVSELEDLLSAPTDELIDAMARLDGDILILGVGGKMGPSMARLAVRAAAASGVTRRIVGVSTFSTPGLRDQLEAAGVETVQADLLVPGAVDALPEAPNVLSMIGRKFGSTGAEWNTWGANVLLSGLIARRFRNARIVAFSSGNIYPFVPVAGGGAAESTPPGPVGEYAMTCLGRERIFDHASRTLGTKVVQLRLNYAVEMRYGVLVDIAANVWNNRPVDLAMGWFNCVWQGYANSVALRAFDLADTPARVLNLTGPEIASVRDVATRMGRIMGRTPAFSGSESDTALLNNAAECHRLFGLPHVALDTMVEWVANWVMNGRELLGKPTHFDVRNGKF